MIDAHEGEVEYEIGVNEKDKTLTIQLTFKDIYELLQAQDVIVHALKEDGAFLLQCGGPGARATINYENLL